MRALVLLFGLLSLTGKGIMDKSIHAGKWKDMKGEMILTLQKEGGESKERIMEFFSQKYKDDLTRMLIRIKSPASMAGMAFLYIEKEGEDERYLYIPALRRTERIVASGKSGKFFSSDFTYYDVGKPQLEDWIYNLKSETDIHFIIEAVPANKSVEKETGYSKIVYTVRKDNYLVEGADYYDRLKEKVKELKVKSWTTLKDGSPFATEMEMFNIKEKHRSTITFKNIIINTGIKEYTFSVRGLRR